jgi:hypothetical protein
MNIGPSVASISATAAAERMNRPEDASLGQDLRSVATVSAAALPMAKSLSAMPALAKPLLEVPGKAFSFLGMMEGVRDTFSNGFKAASSFQMTSLEANNKAFDQAWDASIAAGGSIDDASAAGVSAWEQVLADGWSGVKEHGMEAGKGAWKATTNGIDFLAPLPYGTGMDIAGKSMLFGFSALAASSPAQQDEAIRFAFLAT